MTAEEYIKEIDEKVIGPMKAMLQQSIERSLRDRGVNKPEVPQADYPLDVDLLGDDA